MSIEIRFFRTLCELACMSVAWTACVTPEQTPEGRARAVERSLPTWIESGDGYATVQVHEDQEPETFMAEKCPLGWRVVRDEPIPVGATNTSSTFAGRYGGFTTGTSRFITERRVTFVCEDQTRKPASDP